MHSPQPSSINYSSNIPSLLPLSLLIQILTPIFIPIHYSSNIQLPFSSLQHIITHLHNPYILTYLHPNPPSFFFILIFIHIPKPLYYPSYTSPTLLLSNLPLIIFILTIPTPFLPYSSLYPHTHTTITILL
ncbi:hypothetical protein ACRFB9_28420 [Klebsiella pneumoniae]